MIKLFRPRNFAQLGVAWCISAGAPLLASTPASSSPTPPTNPTFSTYTPSQSAGQALTVGQGLAVPISSLFPTQPNVGLRETAINLYEKYLEKGSPAFGGANGPFGSGTQLTTYLEKSTQIIPVIVGPGGVLYLTDGHHGLFALDMAAQLAGMDPTVYVYVIGNYSTDTPSQFVSDITGQTSGFPVDTFLFNDGNSISFSQLPSSIGGETDDPYRSLSGILDKSNGWNKGPYFGEFIWANYFRSMGVSIGDNTHWYWGNDAGYQSTLLNALNLARQAQVLQLPGAGNNYGALTFANGTSVQLVTTLSTGAAAPVDTAVNLRLLGIGTITTAGAGTTFTMGGNIDGAGGLTINGGGTLVFGGPISNVTANPNETGSLTLPQTYNPINTYAGATTVSAGTLRVGTANALSPFSDITVASGATLDFNSLNSNMGALSGAGSVTLGSGTARLGASNAGGSFSGVISGSGGVTKVGNGTEVFSGQNTYTGPTTVNAGTLQLDFSGSNTAKLSSSSALVLGGGALVVSGNNSSATTQTVNGLTVNAGQSTITVGGGNLGSVAATLGLGAINRNTGGTLDFEFAPGGSASTSNTNNTYGILGAWATVNGSSWAVVNSGSISSLASYVNTNAAYTSGGTGDNVDVNSSNNAPTAAIDWNTMRFNSPGSLTLTLSGSTNSIGTNNGTVNSGSLVGVGGILMTNLVGANTITITGSKLNVNGNGGDLDIIQNDASGVLDLASIISKSNNVVISGANTAVVILDNASNSFTGTLQINGAVVRASVVGDLGNPANPIALNGGTFETTMPMSLTGTSSSPFTVGDAGGTLRNDFATTFIGGAVSGTGALTVVGGSSASNGLEFDGSLAGFTGTLQVSSGIVSLNNAAATSAAVTVSGPGTLNLIQSATVGSIADGATGLGAITLINSSILTFGSNALDTTFSGNILGSSSTGLVKTGTGLTTLTGYLGGFSGTVAVNGGGELSLAQSSASQIQTLGSAAASYTVGGQTFTVNAVSSGFTALSLATTNGSTLALNGNNLTLSSIASVTANDLDGLSSSIGGIVDLGSATLTLNLTGNASNLTYNGGIIGTGNLVVYAPTAGGKNTVNMGGTGDVLFTGSTVVGGFAILAAKQDSSFSPGSEVFLFDNATLNLGGNNETIAALSGTANTTVAISGSGSGKQGMLTVGDSSNTTFAGTITNGGTGFSPGNVTKVDPGTLTLSGINTYSGATSILGGAISIAADSGIGTAPTTATANSLNLDGGSLQTTATFTLNANRGVYLGSNNGGFIVSSGTTLTYNGVVAGSVAGGVGTGPGGVSQNGGLVKQGAGSLVLGGANTYVGATAVNQGALLVTGSYTGGGAYTMSGGSLGGAGGSITASGVTVTNTPGSGLNISGMGLGTVGSQNALLAPGKLTLNLGTGVLDISQAGANSLLFVLAAPSTSDEVLLASGTLNLGSGSLGISDFGFDTSNWGSNPVGVYTLIDTSAPGDISGTLASGNSETIGAYKVTLLKGSDGSGNAALQLSVAAVPEPSSLWLALGGLGLMRFRRRSAR